MMTMIPPMLLAWIAVTLLLLSIQTSNAFSPISTSVMDASCSNPISTAYSYSSSTQLFYAENSNNSNNNGGNNSNNNNNNNSNESMLTTNNVRRTSIKGISVSPLGFLMLLQSACTTTNVTTPPASTATKSPNMMILPVRLTSTNQDTFATTSAESLTICQLLSGVDMAGAILNPDTLKHLVGLYCSSSLDDEDEDEDEDDNENENERKDLNLERDENGYIIVEDELGLDFHNDNGDGNHDYDEEYYEESDEKTLAISSTFQQQYQEQNINQETKSYVHEYITSWLLGIDLDVHSFEDANTYQRNKVKFPKISLDSIQIDLPFIAKDDDIHDRSESQTIELWKDYVMTQTKTNTDQDQPFDQEQRQKQGDVLPLPLQFTLECRIDDHYKLKIPLFSELNSLSTYILNLPQEKSLSSSKSMDELSSIIEESRNIVSQVLYSYDDHSSGSFLSLALALRYECPIVITARALSVMEEIQSSLMNDADDVSTPIIYINQDKNDDDEEQELKKVLPHWRSTKTLQSQSQRVVENIEQGFQITKLQGALKIALSKGDELAVKKIRAEIDKLMGNGD